MPKGEKHAGPRGLNTSVLISKSYAYELAGILATKPFGGVIWVVRD